MCKRVWLCNVYFVYLCPSRCRSSSRHGYPGNFGGTFVYVYDCAGERLSIILAAHLCVCARVCVRECVRARVDEYVLQSLVIGIPLSH